MTLQRAELPRRRTKRVPFVLSNFGGLNDDSNNAALDDRDLRTAQNIMFYRERLVGGRFGYIRDPFPAALNSGAAITGIVDWHPDRESAPRTIFVAGNAILEDDGGGPPRVPLVQTNNAAPQVGVIHTFGVLQGKLIGTAGGTTDAAANTPWELTVSGAAPDGEKLVGWFGDDRTCRYLHAQFGYLFAAGFIGTTSTRNAMTVHHSQLQDPNTWLEGSVVDKIGGFNSFGDEYVTGLFQHRDFLMIGTNKRIYPVLYTGDVFGRFAVQRPLEVGLAHQRAVASVNGEFTFFMDPQGHVHTIREAVNAFGDVGVSRSLTSKIRNYITDLNRSRIRLSHAVFLEDRGWIVFAVSKGVNQAAHNELLILDINQFPLDDPDPRAARWLRWTNVAANSMAVLSRDRRDGATAVGGTGSAPQTEGFQQLVFGSTTGWVKRFADHPTSFVSYDEADDGTQDVIETELATKYFDFGHPTSEKAVVEGIFDMEPSEDIQGPTVTMEYDYGVRVSPARQINMTGNIAPGVALGAFILDVDRLASAEQITRNRIALLNAGTNVSMRIQKDLSGTQSWKMQLATLVVEQRGLTPENP